MSKILFLFFNQLNVEIYLTIKNFLDLSIEKKTLKSLLINKFRSLSFEKHKLVEKNKNKNRRRSSIRPKNPSS